MHFWNHNEEAILCCRLRKPKCPIISEPCYAVAPVCRHIWVFVSMFQLIVVVMQCLTACGLLAIIYNTLSRWERWLRLKGQVAWPVSDLSRTESVQRKERAHGRNPIASTELGDFRSGLLLKPKARGLATEGLSRWQWRCILLGWDRHVGNESLWEVGISDSWEKILPL